MKRDGKRISREKWRSIDGQAPELLAQPPVIEKVDVLAAKLP